MAKRKARAGEVVCRCGAYPFPHRQFGGRCISDVLTSTWESQRGCRGCRMFDPERHECQALQGLEHWIYGDCMEEHIRSNEIRLYGVNKPDDWKNPAPRRKRQ